MSFYRHLLAAVAAIAIVSPVFADEEAAAPAAATDKPAAMEQAATTEKAAVSTKVNLNKATAKELMKVKGINAAKSRAIVAYRKKNGDFKSVEDLAKVKGFAKMKAEEITKIEAHLSVE